MGIGGRRPFSCARYCREEPEEKMDTNKVELNLEAKLANIGVVVSAVEKMLNEAKVYGKSHVKICIATEEIFANIANYAYEDGEGDVLVKISLEEDPKAMTICFIDSGIPYDPLAKPDPDIELSAAKRQIGGLGIFMVKQSMDEMHYERSDGHNILTIKKVL